MWPDIYIIYISKAPRLEIFKKKGRLRSRKDYKGQAQKLEKLKKAGSVSVGNAANKELTRGKVIGKYMINFIMIFFLMEIIKI